MKSFTHDVNSGICKYLINPQKMTDVGNYFKRFPTVLASIVITVCFNAFLSKENKCT